MTDYPIFLWTGDTARFNAYVLLRNATGIKIRLGKAVAYFEPVMSSTVIADCGQKSSLTNCFRSSFIFGSYVVLASIFDSCTTHVNDTNVTMLKHQPWVICNRFVVAYFQAAMDDLTLC